MRFYLLIHAGYDFEPTTLAVCSTPEKAEQMREAHYAVAEHQDFPWNGCYVQAAELDAWVPYPESGSVRSLGATLPDEPTDPIGRSDVSALARSAGIQK